MKRRIPSLDPPYRTRRDVSPQERALWEEALSGKKKIVPAPGAPSPSQPAKRQDSVAPARAPSPVIDKATYQRLKRGAVRIDAKLDLHGHTRESAYAVLLAFIETQTLRGARTLLIITGKGRADACDTLRALLPRWLGESPLRERIIAYDSAGLRHGGAGAWYVRLRKSQEG